MNGALTPTGHIVSRAWRLGVALVVGWLLVTSSVAAQSPSAGVQPGETATTSPKLRSPTVTATVRPRQSPPNPVLVTPGNNAILRSGVVLFEWTQSDHIVPLDRFELSLNGSKYFDRIHVTPQETDDYVLTVDGNRYSLRLKQDKWLPDGLYTWKIRVVDTNDLGADSTTWSFTVDSTPPPLIITEIDTDPYAISAQDPATFPQEPIAVDSRRPLLRGKTETGSLLQLKVFSENGSLHSKYETTLTGDGTFYIILDTLPVNEVMHLTFVSIDPAENTTVLDAIYLVYQQRVITIPLPDIFPTAITLEIRYPFRLPRLLPPRPRDDIEVPVVPDRPDQPDLPQVTPVPQVPTEPAPRVFARPVKPTGLIGWFGVFGLGWYVIVLYWLAGSAWSGFAPYLVQLIRFWFLPWWGEHHDQAREAASGRLLPWMTVRLQWLDQHKKLRRRWVVTSVQGKWTARFLPGLPAQVEGVSRRMIFPARTITVGETHQEGTRQIHLTGQSVLRQQEGSKARTSSQVVVVPPQVQPEYVVWFDPNRRSQVAAWQLWLPRLGLAVAFVSSLWLAYFLPNVITLLALLVIFWIGVRDVHARMVETMRVYATE